MTKAQHDLNTAKYNFKGGIFDAAIFYAQQAAEKMLKAVLIKKTNHFPKIHDLTKLAKLIGAPNAIIELCAKINPAYTVSRYPDQIDKYSKEDCEDILNAAEEVLEWAAKKMT